jgi:hypothetical protein
LIFVFAAFHFIPYGHVIAGDQKGWNTLERNTVSFSALNPQSKYFESVGYESNVIDKGSDFGNRYVSNNKGVGYSVGDKYIRYPIQPYYSNVPFYMTAVVNTPIAGSVRYTASPVAQPIASGRRYSNNGLFSGLRNSRKDRLATLASIGYLRGFRFT